MYKLQIKWKLPSIQTVGGVELNNYIHIMEWTDGWTDGVKKYAHQLSVAGA